jgi:hypothetical protein
MADLEWIDEVFHMTPEDFQLLAKRKFPGCSGTKEWISTPRYPTFLPGDKVFLLPGEKLHYLPQEPAEETTDG